MKDESPVLVSRLARTGQFLQRQIRDLILIVGITAIIFALANYVAYKILPAPSLPYDVLAAVDWPGSPASIDLYRKVFGLSPDEDALARFKASPPMVMHPTLPFATQSIENRYFRVGLEGIRYEPGWDDAQVAALLAGSRPLIFALGGSTTLGHGLAGDETWPNLLNRVIAQTAANVPAPRQPLVINFGAQAYDQRTEIEKLIYLLNKGYRPRAVLLLDGWNDLFFSRSNMRLVDKVIYHGFARGRGEIAFTPGGLLNPLSYLDLVLEYSPLLQLIRHWQRGPQRVEHVKFDRDAFTDGFDFREADFMYRYWALFGEQHRERFKQEIVDYYRHNLKLLKALADSYGFALHVFYQPNGLLDSTNPFVPAAARTAPGYRYISELAATVRAAIAHGDLAMSDISNALNDMAGQRYLDVAHYTPEANRELARTIARQLR